VVEEAAPQLKSIRHIIRPLSYELRRPVSSMNSTSDSMQKIPLLCSEN